MTRVNRQICQKNLLQVDTNPSSIIMTTDNPSGKSALTKKSILTAHIKTMEAEQRTRLLTKLRNFKVGTAKVEHLNA